MDKLTILALSAPSEGELECLRKESITFLRTHPELEVASVAYSANSSAAHHHPHRLAVVGGTCTELAEKLESGTFFCGEATFNEKLCFLFSAYGTSYPQMGRKLYQTSPEYQHWYDLMGTTVAEECSLLAGVANYHDTEVQDRHIDIAVTAATSMAISKLWESWGIKPDLVLGHCLGEYPASFVAGIHSADEVAKFAAFVADNQEQIGGDGMVILRTGERASLGLIKDALSVFPGNGGGQEWLELTGANKPNLHVVGGTRMALKELLHLAGKSGILTVALPHAQVFHTTRGMDPVAPALRRLSESLTYRRPGCTFISSMTGGVKESLEPDYWARHLCQPVRFPRASATAFAEGASVFLEVGGGSTVSGMVQKSVSGLSNPASATYLCSLKEGADDLETMYTSLAQLFVLGRDVCWEGFFKDVPVSPVDIPWLT